MKCKVDLYRVALSGPDHVPVFRYGEPLLFVVFYNSIKGRSIKLREASSLHTGDERGDGGPAVAIERNSNFARIVSKHEAEKFT